MKSFITKSSARQCVGRHSQYRRTAVALKSGRHVVAIVLPEKEPAEPLHGRGSLQICSRPFEKAKFPCHIGVED